MKRNLIATPLKNQLMRRIFCTLIIIFFAIICYSQRDFSAATWKYIDTSLEAKRKLSDLQNLVQQLKQKALTEKKYFYATRCYHYQLKITDERTEDSFYFRNSAFIDSILKTPDLPKELQVGMHVLQANRLAGFGDRYNRFAKELYRNKPGHPNYSAYTNKQLDSLAQLHYEQAKAIAKDIPQAGIEEAIWISYEPTLFLFKPTIYDIITAEQVRHVYSITRYDHHLDSVYERWLPLSVDQFIAKMDSVSRIDSIQYLILKCYYNWMNHHKNNPSAYYYIETLARKYFYEKNKSDFPKAEEKYERYLQAILSSPLNTVKAHAVYQLCLLWREQAKRYFPPQNLRYDYTRSSYRDYRLYDTAYQYHAVKALQLFYQNRASLDSFAFLENNLLAMEQEIKDGGVFFKMQEFNLPGEPILAELRFRNTTRVYYRLKKIDPLFKIAYNTSRKVNAALQKLPVLLSDSVVLPATDDHNNHGAYVKINALPPGNYIMYFSHLPITLPITDTSENLEMIFFKVSSIAMVNSDKRVFILDRKTGFPLVGAKVKGYHRPPGDTLGSQPLFSRNYTVNQKGFIDINDTKITGLDIFYKNDTLFETIGLDDEEVSDYVYNKEDYDDLVEFYDDNSSVYIFTDRSIYRPGQTVHFKAIYINRNKDTGEPVIMNRENMVGELGGSVYDKWLKEKPELYLSDPFERETDTIKVKLNEYGSVSGSFKIPKTAATGPWSIEPSYAGEESKGGRFRVEEYKRPTYEISIMNPQKELLPGDSFSFRVKVRSFAGSPMNNVRVKYSVRKYPGSYYWNEEEMEKFIDTTGFTNAEGELIVPVTDHSLAGFKWKNDERESFSYEIKAEAIDASGESYSENSNLYISSQPLSISLPDKDAYNRNEKNSLPIKVNHQNGGKVTKDVHVKIYRNRWDDKIYNDRQFTATDIWLYDKKQLEQWFPNFNILHITDTLENELVLDTVINTGKDEKLELDPKIFIVGDYKIEAECMENGRLLGQNSISFAVFDEKDNKVPGPDRSFYHITAEEASPGDTIIYYNGDSKATVYSIFHLSWYSAKKKKRISEFYDTRQQEAGLHRWIWKIPDDAMNSLAFTQLYMLNNEIFTHEKTITIHRKVEEPEIIIEKYRKKLTPGSKETFAVTVKTKNVNTAVELMTTMYDASLDKLNAHLWEKPEPDSDDELEHVWPSRMNSEVANDHYYNYYNNYNGNFFYNWRLGAGDIRNKKPLWWLNPLDYGYRGEDVMGAWKNTGDLHANTRFTYMLGGAADMDGALELAGRPYGLAGYSNNLRLTIPGAQSLFATRNYQRGNVIPYLYSSFQSEELNVIGTAVPFLRIGERTLSGNFSAISIQQIKTLIDFRQPLIILDGVPYTGDISQLDPATITMAIVLKGVDATEFYGPKAAQGVLVLSTKGEIIFPAPVPEPPLPTRKNFNETAFFFPAVYADKDGYYSFTFTMPESVTEWNWKLMGHTKQVQFAYAERKLNTQLPLMVQPNMPRLLYQGDRVVLQSRITNLDSAVTNGQAVCRIEDAVTGEDITSSLTTKSQNDFSIEKKANISSAFEIKVPVTQLNPIKIVITVRSQNFADGEEHIIPVLSPRILVRDNTPFRFSKAMDTTIQVPKLPGDAELYGTGIYIQPKPQAALINALPYLANYSFDCAEQTFNKMLAHVTAVKIMRTDEEAQKAFAAAKAMVAKEPEQKEQLPDELSEETMPWMNLSNKTKKQQEQLFQLLDTVRTKDMIEEYRQKLKSLRNKDGGMAWFKGGKSDHYISNYILASLGKLNKEKLLPVIWNFKTDQDEFIDNLVEYCDAYFMATIQEKGIASLPYYIYARSFWKESYPLTDSSLKKVRTVLQKVWAEPGYDDLYHQTVLVIATLRFFDKESKDYQKAIEQLNSIHQLAIMDDVNGIRWKELSSSDDMTYSSEETLGLIAEAFTQANIHPEISHGIIKWLLSAKTEHHWSSTKSTSAVIGMLSRENKTTTGAVQTISAKINNQAGTVTDNLLKGNSYTFIKDNKPAIVELKKQSNAPVAGNMIWYYFTGDQNYAGINKEVSLKKELFRYNTATNKWELINGQTSLKIADKIKIELTIETSKSLKYVYIDDKRAAAFEPRDIQSGYQYTEGLNYYLSVRDAGMQFFSEFIPAGKSKISYEMIVAQEGSFINGPASLQCMYKPEVNAYSNSVRVQTIK